VERKEDGFYIDPRTNGGTNIDAITLDDVITVMNGSVISRHAKRQNDGDDEFAAETRDEGKKSDEKDDENTTEEAVIEETVSEDKSSQRKRREIPVNEDSNGKESAKADVQPVSTNNQTTAPQNSTYTECPKSPYLHCFNFRLPATVNILNTTLINLFIPSLSLSAGSLLSIK
jgi:hypothetical protein